ncbi:DeoR/GlpR transcriptional regulator [Tardiphaga sp. vice352]|uniref:DeoR/GlpR family DNA-binding transcription regulator n=1 Tax=unclassified Tardiphaga TaxID=2631404 RepID=UPI00116520A6|nr:MULTISPECIES: DeoR/GlpR family DNA-binding transcription regulator [unclassified Tardiphaga]QDM15903.1 DeoR/GlpR transcriptional regulator [Tardiphaga sp. vice278]QDM21004.1 DeoR/GlpR transcriptional regulator [Tardiphaga sp. vice154]QDM26100.1 DeoR/GlpR transcriptional regulator [Tardiphaga sp. vice304]QDM31248.1 DeoR/GlpR transcriptional regulator [Tardiphaga sp. vice352]
MSMRSKERHARLLEALNAGEIDVDDLARRFDVSASTVRRDLQHLSRNNAVLRTYGGAILTGPAAETTLEQRLAVQGKQKQAIACAAAELIRDGDTLILDAGSTVAAFGRLLLQRRLRVITNNLALLPFLAKAPSIDLVVLGGALRTTSMSTMGPLAHDALRRMTADRAIMSADGVVSGRGLCEADLEQVALKSLMMEQAKDVIVLADAGKLGRAEQSAWAPLPPRWTLVTDAGASDEQRQRLTDAGARVIVAGGR